MYFDTHAHYDDEAFNDDREALLAAMPENSVEMILVPGCDVKSSRSALELAMRFPFIRAAVGIHPEDLAAMAEGDLERIEAMAGEPGCVAIGEIGLDDYGDASRKEEQKALFRRQIEIALARKLPVIVHDREAHGDSLDIVRDYAELRGVFHCFSGSPEMAEELLCRGWYLGFDGPVTYKNARKALEVLDVTPLDRILVETDSPYMSPVPLRGKRNDSSNLIHVIQKIAEVKGVPPEEIEHITCENGKRLFRIS